MLENTNNEAENRIDVDDEIFDDVQEDVELLEDLEPLKIINNEIVSDDSLQLYFKNISAYKPLPMEQEQELGVKIKQGDTSALKELVLANLKFVVSVANKYKNSGVPIQDLINQGNIGLLEAARRYDPDKGVKFITYAVWWIRQAIIHGLSGQTGSVRLPIKQANNLYKINSARERLTKELKHDPTDFEISAATGVSMEDIQNISMVSRNHLSLDAPMGSDEDRTFLDNLEDENSNVENDIIKKTMKSAIDEIVAGLSVREADIITKRFGLDDGEPKTLEDIGEELKISRERVRQIEVRALQKMRKTALRKHLNDYLN